MRQYWGVKISRYLKSHRSRKFRHRINQIVRMYCKEQRHQLFYQSDMDFGNPNPITGWDELHLPQMKDIYDPWAWD